MTEVQREAIRAIEEQQKRLPKGTCPWVVGEQLKDICAREPKSAELLINDLRVPEMDLSHAERKIYEYGKKQCGKNGGFGVSPFEAEKVLREFYKLPDRDEEGQTPVEEQISGKGQIVDLDDFFT